MDDEQLETEIRKALDARAHEVDVPVDLMTRTLQTANAGAQRSLRDRLRARLDAWRMRAPVTGLPRWLYVPAAGAMAAALFGVGALVTREPAPIAVPARGGVEVQPAPASGGSSQTTEQGGAIAGQRSGKVQADTGATSVEPGHVTSGPAQVLPPEPPVPGPTQPGQFPPKIVRNATIEVEVRSFDTAWVRANDVASKYQGFVVNSNTEQIKDKLGRGTLQIRVPAAKLDAALKDLRSLGKLTTMNTSGEDVSAQIVDLDARRKTLETEEFQLLDLLRRANGVSEVLEVRTQLNSVRQEIESLKAQKAYYANAVDYATINATIFERGASPDESPPGDDGVLFDAWHTALRVGLTILAGLLVVLGGLIPLVALGLLVWAGVRMARRGRNTA
jgi:hypothetical protein